MGDNVNVSPSGSVPIATDDIEGVQFQKIKVNLGDDGVDAGLVGRQNPLPVEIGGFFRLLKNVFGRFSFDATSQLRTAVTGSVSISGTASTNVSTMTTGNIGIGDWSKNATDMQQSQQSFMTGIRRNFSRV